MKMENGEQVYIPLKLEEYEVIDTLSRKYNIKELCRFMGVSRSGYYKWKKKTGQIQPVEAPGNGHRDC